MSSASPHAPAICDPGADVAILFARTPVPGRVKSRLLTHLTPEQACRLHVASVLDTAELLASVFQQRARLARWIFWSELPAPDSSGFGLPPSLRCALQQGEDLGERMGNAFKQAFGGGARRVVIIGSDSPHLPASRIAQSFVALEAHDCVLGPADDGGYYLVGCRRFDPSIFHHVTWSSPTTFQQTLANASRIGYKTYVLESWYDLDEWRDIQRLSAEGRPPPRHVAAFLSELKRNQGKAPDSESSPH
jgi:rSAM/selenodomain-associated transferase 1